jgi:hypothetical protein
MSTRGISGRRHFAGDRAVIWPRGFARSEASAWGNRGLGSPGRVRGEDDLAVGMSEVEWIWPLRSGRDCGLGLEAVVDLVGQAWAMRIQKRTTRPSLATRRAGDSLKIEEGPSCRDQIIRFRPEVKSPVRGG